MSAARDRLRQHGAGDRRIELAFSHEAIEWQRAHKMGLSLDPVHTDGSELIMMGPDQRRSIFRCVDALLHDIRLAWRRLRKSPSFTLVAILTLTLGIGANTAIFTLLHALILRDLAVRNPSELVQLSMVMRNGQEAGLSFPAFQQIQRDSQEVFSSLVGWIGGVILTAEANGDDASANSRVEYPFVCPTLSSPLRQ